LRAGYELGPAGLAPRATLEIGRDRPGYLLRRPGQIQV
jgi:hypothetical protein